MGTACASKSDFLSKTIGHIKYKLPSRRIIAGREFLFQQGDCLMSGPRTVRAPRGTELTCKNWLSEAAYRMIQNNLDPEVAEKPDDLVVYGGRGKAARDWESFDAIL